ncbi:SUMF1/EgtB/PvdO family nonheme iron enzyme [Bradyrhizobium sp.]|uniref:SUMF1/EgtB/PvdO family nonheme iron enzyme n=1 Tax=Bradyrhizobium sp. TaxID=376 RepID=UPI004037AB5E
MLIAFKLKLALACVAGLAGPLAVAPLLSDAGSRGGPAGTEQALVEVRAGNVVYRVAGDFTRNGRQASAPLRQISFDQPLVIMKHQVSAAEYQTCVDDGACRALDRGVTIAADRPAVQVSWHDANAYAAWLSRKTGETYRLPTDEEWALAAGSRFKDDGLPVDDNDPSKRWIAKYERESERTADAETRAFGSFGLNENGLADLAGNVWEWTSTCFTRYRLDDAGKTVSATPNCGVRVVEGQHRSYVTDFIRNARGGGCAAGVPPDNLGFRLVREPRSWIGRVAGALHIARG